MALAAVACALAAWLAGPAHANGPVAGVPAPVTAVQQATAPVVRTIEASPVRIAASPRHAARANRARAAVAESAATSSTRVAAAPKSLAVAVDTVASGSLAAAIDAVARLGSIASARPDGEPARLGGPTTSAGKLLASAATAHSIRPTVPEGWRHATATREAPIQPLGRSGGEPVGIEIPAPQPVSPSSASGLAGGVTMALLALPFFGSQRPGALVWLRGVGPRFALPRAV